MGSLLRDLAPFLGRFRPQWGWMALGTLLGIVTVAAGAGLLALSGWFISAAALAGLTPETAHLFNFFYPSIGVRLFAFARTAARYGDRIISHDAAFRILETLRVWFYRQIEPLGPGPLGGFRSGDLLSRAVSDIDALDNLYLRVIQPTVVALFLAVMLPAFLLSRDAGIALAAGGGILAAGLAVSAASGKMGAAAGKAVALRVSRLRTRIVDGLQGAPELVVFGAAGPYLAAIREEDRGLTAEQRRMSRIRGLSGALTTLLSGLTVGVVLWLGAEAVRLEEMAGPGLALAAMAVLAAFEAVAPLPSAYQFLGRTREAAARLTEIVRTPPAVRFPPVSAGPPRGFDLTLEGVGFRYAAGASPALAEISLHLPEGGRLVVSGHTGAGKTTLVNLLVRFWDPTEGRILIGGRDIRSYSETDLRKLVSVVSQQAHLFNASIRDNLRVARPDASEDEMREALSAARLLDVVENLPEGLDTWIGEGGRELSGGQARRLSVARALLHDAPVWILDEPTEGLDTVTERELMASLFRRIRGKTLILITHRLPAAILRQRAASDGGVPAERPSDRILRLDRGRLVRLEPMDFSF